MKCGEIRSDEVLNKVLDMLDLLNRDLLSRMGRLEHDMGELIASLREKDEQLSKLIDKLG